MPAIDEPPTGEFVGLRVGQPEAEGTGEQWRRWEEGELLVFDDSFDQCDQALCSAGCCGPRIFARLLNLLPGYSEVRWPTPSEEAASSTVGEYEDGETGGARYVLYASLWHPSLGEPTLPEERRWPSAVRALRSA